MTDRSLSIATWAIVLVGGTALSIAGAPANPDANTWSQFRGPHSSGVALGAQPPVKLGTNSLVWKTPVPPGTSSPVLSRSRIFLTALDGERLLTLAFEAESGRLAWRREAPKVPLEIVHTANSPAAPTPLVDGQRVHVYLGSYGLLCYDHEGREQWRKPIATPKSLYGLTTSPIAHRDNLILVLDDDANLPDSKLSRSRVIALKRATGELIWETSRAFLRSGWSTPIIWPHETGEDLVVLGSGRVCGYDPMTGTEKWFATGFSRETIAQPVSGRGRVYVSAAMLGGVSDEQPDPQPFWAAMLTFDSNHDGRIERAEMTEHFTFPFRPELPVGHPGFGRPLASDAVKRREQQAGIFASTDKNKDGFWTRDEFVSSMRFDRGKPQLMAIRPGGSGDVTSTHVDWQVHQGIPEIPSPLFYEDRIYLARNGGILTAVNATSGKVIYSERLGSAGQYSASPVAARGHVYLVSNQGVVSVVKAGDAFQLVSQHALGESVAATPALAGNKIHVRTDAHLVALGER